MDEQPQNKYRNYVLCLILAAFSVVSAVYLLRHLWLALRTGRTLGRLGSVYFYPSGTYFVHLLGYTIGICLAIGIMVLVCKWLLKQVH